MIETVTKLSNNHSRVKLLRKKTPWWKVRGLGDFNKKKVRARTARTIIQIISVFLSKNKCMLEMIGRLYKILPEEKITDKYKIVEIVLNYPSNDNKDQYRYMQCVSRALGQIGEMQVGDLVKVKVGLKGKIKNDKFYNLDEVYEITRA